MSAGQSSRLMEEKLNEALGNGTVPKLDSRKMQVHLQLGARKRVLLVESDGTVTQEGRHVYRAMGVPPPTIYPYEQPLINGKWVTNFPGAPTKNTLVGGRGNRPTAKGEAYFKYNRDAYYAEFPYRIARPVTNKNFIGPKQWRLDRVTFEYIQHDLDDLFGGDGRWVNVQQRQTGPPSCTDGWQACVTRREQTKCAASRV